MVCAFSSPTLLSLSQREKGWVRENASPNNVSLLTARIRTISNNSPNQFLGAVVSKARLGPSLNWRVRPGCSGNCCSNVGCAHAQIGEQFLVDFPEIIV